MSNTYWISVWLLMALTVVVIWFVIVIGSALMDRSAEETTE